MARKRRISQTLPQTRREVWQGGWFQVPLWVTEPGEKPLRLWIPLWVCPGDDGHVAAGEAEVERGGNEALLTLLDEMFETLGRRPEKVEVSDPDLSRTLEPMLKDAGIDLGLSQGLKYVDEVFAAMAESAGVPDMPGMLEVPGLEVEAVRSFAQAACTFYEAEPWRHLSDRDVLEIRAMAPQGMCYASVLGMGGQTYGLGFYDDLGAFWRMASGELPRETNAKGLWSVTFGPLQHLPVPDAELFVNEELAVACPTAYPLAFAQQSNSRVKRPSPRVMEFLTGLLRALAASRPEDMDRGRWELTVDTPSGGRSYELLLPFLQQPPSHEERARHGVLPDPRAFESVHYVLYLALGGGSDPDDEAIDLDQASLQDLFRGDRPPTPKEMGFEPRNDTERAQLLCFEAFDAWGRDQIRLVERVLALDPGSVDALSLKAEREPDPTKRAALYRKAIEAAEERIPRLLIDDHMGELFSYYPTRSYLRAIHDLAHTLELTADIDASVSLLKRLLELDEEDHLEIRYCLVACLLRHEGFKEATALVKRFRSDEACFWAYADALAAFGRRGKSRKANEALERALRENPLAAAHILDASFLDAPEEDVDEELEIDALHCSVELSAAWALVPSAMDWLARECLELEA